MKAIPELFSPPVPGPKPAATQPGARPAADGPSFQNALEGVQTASAPPVPGSKPLRGVPGPRAGATPAALQVMQATQQATGGDASHYKALLAQATVESRLNPQAKNPRSSAAGAFQFLERTWLDMVRRHGSSMGLGDLAGKVTVRKGVPHVADAATRQQILNLRHDVKLSAGMASRYLSECKSQLSRHLGRQATDTESRIAYVLGVGGAKNLIRTAETKPEVIAATLMPRAAKANQPLFFSRGGHPFTAAEALDNIKNRMERHQRSMFAAIDEPGGAEAAALGQSGAQAGILDQGGTRAATSDIAFEPPVDVFSGDDAADDPGENTSTA
ncbi:MAG TPA: lytic transglycosylase domain-containing protein [Azospirillaceae bacterium]|nr:lytic transglycosylase domain-containing protein [Azospirillaceae bacterium]